MLGRVISNTFKQIKRSGWVAWSSIAVMTLAFFVATIFGGLAYLSNVYIRFIETRDNVLVFFEVGTRQDVIDRLRIKWDDLPQIKSINFTSEEDAYNLYLEETELTKPIEHDLLLQYEQKVLPSSLDIQLHTLDQLGEVREILTADIKEELDLTTYDPSSGEPLPIDLRIDDQSLDELRDVFSALRIGGAVVLTLLFVIIFFFTLMTTEFRTYNRVEEIGVMQLVGGSLAYIRAPYILEGAFYGAFGAFVSVLIIGAVVVGVFVLNRQSDLAIFVYQRLSPLDIPRFSWYGWALLAAAKIGFGFLLGAASSYIAIRRYIK